MAGFCLSVAADSDAQAASQSIRLWAHVPVFCGFKSDRAHGIIPHHRGWPGHGSFKIRCNTPYRMHMDGEWDQPHWPHRRHGRGKDPRRKTKLDVELRVFDRGDSKRVLCSLVRGKKQSCRAFEDGERSPPRLGQAQVTIGPPSSVVRRQWIEPLGGGADPLFGRNGARAPVWNGRMSLGGLPHVASTGELPYLPRFITQMEKERGSNGFDDDLGLADDDEQITLFLMLTGRY